MVVFRGLCVLQHIFKFPIGWMFFKFQNNWGSLFPYITLAINTNDVIPMKLFVILFVFKFKMFATTFNFFIKAPFQPDGGALQKVPE